MCFELYPAKRFLYMVLQNVLSWANMPRQKLMNNFLLVFFSRKPWFITLFIVVTGAFKDFSIDF